MMPRLSRIGAVLALAVGLFVAAPAPTAHCEFCHQVDCYDRTQCGAQPGSCVCIKRPGEYLGYCASIN